MNFFRHVQKSRRKNATPLNAAAFVNQRLRIFTVHRSFGSQSAHILPAFALLTKINSFLMSWTFVDSLVGNLEEFTVVGNVSLSPKGQLRHF